MTPTQHKAMEQAIEALIKSVQFCNYMGIGDWQPTAMACHGGIAALKFALAEPAPEPVAHLWQHGETGRTRVVMPDSVTDCDASWQLIGPLYLAAPVRESAPVPLLTDDEIAADASRHWSEDGVDPMAFGRTIEALVRQKAGL